MIKPILPQVLIWFKADINRTVKYDKRKSKSIRNTRRRYRNMIGQITGIMFASQGHDLRQGLHFDKYYQLDSPIYHRTQYSQIICDYIQFLIIRLKLTSMKWLFRCCWCLGLSACLAISLPWSPERFLRNKRWVGFIWGSSSRFRGSSL